MENHKKIEIATGDIFVISDNRYDQIKKPVIRIENIKGKFFKRKIKKFPWFTVKLGIQFDLTVFTDKDFNK